MTPGEVEEMHEDRATGLIAYWRDYPPAHILARASLGITSSGSDAPRDESPGSLIDQFGGTRGARP